MRQFPDNFGAFAKPNPEPYVDPKLVESINKDCAAPVVTADQLVKINERVDNLDKNLAKMDKKNDESSHKMFIISLLTLMTSIASLIIGLLSLCR